ncbi:flippase [Halorussus halophilus]|uniref:flippase n=1 Tax=Halorussus halophilus TaxID=2650975 RepID=UPI001301031C|nr:flippase [Halorussus halophilus]
MDLDKTSISLYVSRILVSVVGFAGTVYFARLLGASGLGVYFTFETVVVVLGVFGRVGVDNAIVKRLSQSESDAQRGTYLGGGLLLVAIPFAVVSAGVLLFAAQLEAIIELAIAPLVVLTLALTIGRQLVIATLRGERRVATSGGIELLGELARVGASVALVVSGFEVLGLVYGYVLGRVATVVVGVPLLRTRPRLPTRETLRSVFDFSKYTAGLDLSFLAYSWLDTLLLAILATKAAVGVYEAAWRISAVTMLAGQAIGISLAPNVSNWHAAGEREAIENAFTSATTYALVLVFPAVVGAAVLGDAVMGVLYDFDAPLGATVLVVLVAGKLFQALRDVVQSTLLGMERQRPAFWVNVTTLGANFLLNLLLIPEYGILGAAAATVATSGIAALAQFWILRKTLRASIDRTAVAWQAGAALVMGGVVYALTAVVSPATIPGLFALVGAGAAVYGLVVLGHEGMRDRILGLVPRRSAVEA